ncbi:MAG: membrane protein insertion efficiency factor YidD [Acidimicrobiales bacterium]|jgi:putative membrane protein insertion efficiency factor
MSAGEGAPALGTPETIAQTPGLARGPVGGGTRLVVGAVRIYQALRVGRPSPCRFVPSCSEYAATALVEHGTARGIWLSLRRLARCHPLGGSGFDPVPARNVSGGSAVRSNSDTVRDGGKWTRETRR